MTVPGERVTDGVPDPRQERRGTGDRRRYNRRSPVSDVTPPYYETFERIAIALEGIESALRGRVVDLASASATTRSTVSS